ncbi:gfo/Idh/MocA family oxidoreductase [Streptomyces dangxiongensis]|uniref:Gfo/Idh/MocA family oxidoreductase n=1 Tax=Streptomyces dangxiongensis TaxID=1442032 RepID=A0A3G2JB50_9ACTN|nr:Gfo/Idh/MocA family oxidoreductase [Streptomyces dangxiongensis]AYN39394.1 gfo/Idh/MocA family oxidoreductase [Streptomyces dangxiongensis]
MTHDHGTPPVRVGVLGAASIAWRRVVPAMTACPDVDVVAVASRDPRRARRFADRFGCAAVTGYEALLERTDIEAVYVPLPAALHHTWAARALAAGRHVLIEKPMATTAEEARELTALAESRGLVLRENFMFLHHPRHRAVTELLRDGRIGRLRMLHASFCVPPLPPDDIRYTLGLGGGALLDTGVYPLRTAVHFLGRGLRVTGATLRTRPRDGLDLSGQVLLAADSGVLASLDFGFEHGYGARYALWGDRARLTADQTVSPPAELRTQLRIEEQDREERLLLPPADQFLACVTEFAAAIRGPVASRGTGRDPWHADAVATLELVDAVRERAVRVPCEGDGPQNA